MPALSMTHIDWQEQLVELAHLYGWKHLHVRRTVGRGKKWTTSTNRKGWPDLFLWHPKHGFVAIELKIKPDKATAEQLEVLAELEQAGAQAYVWYPDDLETAQLVLSGQSSGPGRAQPQNGQPSSS